jgi:large subunit ribosomal protein L18
MSDVAVARRAHRERRHRSLRRRLEGTGGRPRLAVFRSLRNIYCQVIDDERGATLCASSSADLVRAGVLPAKDAGNVRGAVRVGEEIARRAKEKGVSKVAFDRGGFRYHGRVKALADAARKGGLEF